MAVAQNVARLLARYSEGYRLASEHGPASAIVAEYAYHNTPRGHGPLGRFIDRQFLHLGAWDGVRSRFQATKQLVREEIQRRRAIGQRTTVIDIASGTACYLRELWREDGGGDLDIICRERDAKLVMHARELAAQEETNITFFVGDATDPASYLNARDPDIMIASGLLPLLHRDDVVRQVLQLAFRHLHPGGCLIVTTVTDPHARLSPWESLRPMPARVRSADVVAGLLRANGFCEVESRDYGNGGSALIARKPRDR